MKNTKIIILTILVCTVILLLPNLFYILKFSSFDFSSKPEHWAQYGDFIGGSLNPILTILNIIALVYLTYTVSELEDKRMAITQETEGNRITEMQLIEGRRATEQINVQKLITLNQMRHEVVSELAKVLDSYGNISQDFRDSNSKKTILTITISVQSFRRNAHHLFIEKFTKEFDELYYEPLRSAVEELGKMEFRNPDNTVDFDKMQKVASNYIVSKSKFIQELNSYIIDQMAPNNV